MSYFSTINNADIADPAAREMAKLFQDLAEAEIFDLDPKKPSTIKEGVAFLSKAQGGFAPEFGVFLKLNSSADGTKKLDNIIKFAKKQQLTVTDQDFAGILGKKLTPSSSAAKYRGLNQAIYFASAKDTLALSGSETILTNFFSDTQPRGFDRIKNSMPYKEVLKGNQIDNNCFAFSYFNVAEVASLFMAGAGPAIDNIPVAAFASTRSMSSGLKDDISIRLKPAAVSNLKWLGKLASEKYINTIRYAPSNSLIFLGLGTQLVEQVRSNAEAQLSQADRDLYEKSLVLSKKIKSLALSVGSVTPGSLFPGLVLIAETDNPKSMTADFKSELSKAVSAGGAPLSDWQTKEIDGVQVDFMLSPLGVGVYLAPAKDAVLIGTAENAIREAISAASGGESTLVSTFSSENQKRLKSSPPSLAVHVNLTELATTLEQMQGSLAMFTGGKSNLGMAGLDQLRDMGSTFWTVNYANNLVRLHGTYDPPRTIRR